MFGVMLEDSAFGTGLLQFFPLPAGELVAGLGGVLRLRLKVSFPPSPEKGPLGRDSSRPTKQVARHG